MDKPLLNQSTFFILAICCFNLSLASAFQYTVPTTLEVENAYTLRPVVGAQLVVQQKDPKGKYYNYGVYYTDSLGIVSLSLNEHQVYTVSTKKDNYYTQITGFSTTDISRVDNNKFGLSMRPKGCYRIRGEVKKQSSFVGENYLLLQDLASKESQKIAIHQDGSYYACATCGQNYSLIPYLNGKKQKTDTLTLNREDCEGKRNPLLELDIIPQEISEQPIVEVVKVPKRKYKKGDSMILKNLVFEGKSQVTNTVGNKQLDSLSQDLLKYPDLIIELRVHTDAKKSERYNWLLSRKRSAYIEKYLANKGIKTTQFTVVAVGETEILNDCANGKPCSKEEHAVNNRVELLVLDEKEGE
ncbi:MAG: Unknown protein [uncultured Aureispira sp.]|uniref:OmpA-like domain-containing protein n=1 Tax=uncultured Aureispira sp. TaxID=1331704 RepID=A0A6S6SZQ6_9BACT|nr:MAG: Unknown protein [uncultured Aureispira sp.]